MNRKVFAFAAALPFLAPLAPFGESKGDPYPLDTCPVSGERLGEEEMGDPVVFDHGGREIRFCCDSCVKKFQKDPAKYLGKLDEALTKAQLPFYPLEKCLVSGEKLGGEMGDPVERIFKNRLVRFCCKDCVKDFEKKADDFIAKLDAAVIAKQKPNYPLDACPISDAKLKEMKEPVDYVAGNRLIRFCCKKCIAEFRKEPAKYLARLGAAPKAPEKKEEGKPHKHDGHDQGHGD